jgi:hypothetical protein
MRPGRLAAAAALAILLLPVTLPAQWFTLPLKGTPRTADGSPDLAAPTPRTADNRPDLSGIWSVAPTAGPGPGYLSNIARDLPDGPPLQPWAKALHDERRAAEGAGRPSERCLPHGIPDAMMVRNLPWKIIQTPDVTVILYEEFNNWRQIFTDGRTHPVDPEPAWFGYSVGRWEGDTLVVETRGFKDTTWLDDYGTPHSDALRTVERFRRRDFGHLEIAFTFDDPKAFTQPWSTTVSFDLRPDTELLDHQCDNEKWSRKP